MTRQAVEDCVWLDMACKAINGYVSDDSGLYFALWVIGQGEEVLLAALQDPDSLADLGEIPFGEADFELLMGVGMEDKLAEEQPQFAARHAEIREEIEGTIRFQNDDRYGGYESFDDALDDIPNRLPRLIDRAKAAGLDWENLYSL